MRPGEAKICLFCKSPFKNKTNSFYPDDFKYDIYMFECEFCKKYRITGHDYINISSGGFPLDLYEKGYLVSGYIREKNEFTGEVILLKEKLLETIDYQLQVPKDITEQAIKIIKYIAKKSDYIGNYLAISIEKDFPIAYAKNVTEFITLLRYLIDSGIIEVAGGIPEALSSSDKYRLTVEGWQKYEELKTKTPDTKNCFVAMNFDPAYNEIYEKGIEPAIRNAGFEPIRIDKEKYNEKICDRIIAEIKQSRFMVADFTGQKQAVYFEAGFAMGLGLEVIWLCQEDEAIVVPGFIPG